MSSLVTSYLSWFYDWVNPWYYITISLVFFFVALLGTRPLIVNPRENYSARELSAIYLRRGLLYSLLVLLLIFPIVTGLLGVIATQQPLATYFATYTDYLWIEYLGVWELPLIGYLSGWLLSFSYARYLKPKWSALKRRYAVKQAGDELSDIRVEEGKTQAKQFNPTRYYTKDRFFYGLDRSNKPIYDDDETWRARHQRYVGPTQTGKGIEFGVQLDQAIRKGYCVLFLDPKPDQHARAIMAQACADTGRRFIELDLSPEGAGRYGPFFGGSARDRRARLIYVLGLSDTGGDGDFYKSTEREVIDSLFGQWDGTLKGLRKLLSNPDLKDVVVRSRNYINQWLSLSTFDTTTQRPGFSVERSLLENAVVYVKGDLDDDVLNVACTCLLMEVIQEVKRLHAQRTAHCFIAVDEIAFLISDKIADALATVAGFDANIALAYQSEGDLLNLKDKTQNARAIAQRVKTNCKTSLYYMAMDAETAETMADESGTIQKSVTFSQTVELGRHWEESWDKERSIRKTEESLITVNEAKMLPERVGILYRPNTLAQHVFTSWVPIEVNHVPKNKKATSNEHSQTTAFAQQPPDDAATIIDLDEELHEYRQSNRKMPKPPKPPSNQSIVTIDDF